MNQIIPSCLPRCVDLQKSAGVSLGRGASYNRSVTVTSLAPRTQTRPKMTFDGMSPKRDVQQSLGGQWLIGAALKEVTS